MAISKKVYTIPALKKFLALNSKNIHWCSAPGSNARSVAEWVLGSLIELKLLSGENSIKKVALIGHGNAGSAVAKLLSSIGLEVKAYDPFRKDIHTHEPLVELDGLYDADLLSLHIPYTKSGEHPTSEWIDEKFLKCFPKGIHLLNAARGEVVNENDFLKLKNENFFGKVALDVYHNEPNPDVRVLDAADIATQHVAGYSTTGKIRGTQMLLNEAWVYLGNEGEAPKAKNQKNTIDEPITSWKELPHKVYNPLRDAKNLKEKRESNLAEGFDQLRKEYPYRGEYSDFTLVNQSLELKEMAVKLGFNWQD